MKLVKDTLRDLGLGMVNGLRLLGEGDAVVGACRYVLVVAAVLIILNW